jgi:DNA-binding Lrp family transcriptional regulator
MTREAGTETRPGPAHLDAADEALLAALGADGRASYEALAREVGLSRAAVRSRVHRLLDSGIAEVAGIVHPSVFGLDAWAHVRVDSAGPAAPVAERLAAFDELPLVSLVTGAHPIVVEIRARDRQALTTAVRRIADTEGVRDLDVAVYLEILKGANVPPRPYSPIVLDDIDRLLLSCLQGDGRVSFARVGEAVGLSVGAARARVLRLLEAGVVHVGVRLRPDAQSIAQTGVGIRLGHGGEQATATLAELPALAYLATSLGGWDLVGTLHTPPHATLEALDALRAVPGVTSVESWRHLRFVKERYEPEPAAPDGP